MLYIRFEKEQEPKIIKRTSIQNQPKVKGKINKII